MKWSLPGLAALWCLSGCISHQELVNFTDPGQFPDRIPEGTAITIQTDDLLQINVYNSDELDRTATAPYNLQPLGQPNSNQSYSSDQYLVDEDGFIYFPGIGPLLVGGLGIREVKDTLRTRLQKYLNDPIINVRIANFRITIEGEVKLPGTYRVDAHRINLLEAIGYAGDLTNYARRDSILVIREVNGVRTYGRVSLKDKQVFSSPYFYLRQNDVVYVEPLRQKVGAVSDQTNKVLPWVSLGTTFLNLLIILTRR